MPTTTNYIWDEQRYLAESDATNTINAVYTNEPQRYGSLVSSRISGTTSYHEFDALGSTRQMTSPGGSTTDTVIYDAWGKTVARMGSTAISLLWIGAVGYYSDVETGLVFVRSRVYAPATSRWSSSDLLIALAAKDASRTYGYVRLRPTLRADPSGLSDNEEGAPESLNVELVQRTCNACGYIDWKWEYDKRDDSRLTKALVVQWICIGGGATICVVQHDEDTDEDCCLPKLPQKFACCFFEWLGIIDVAADPKPSKAGDHWTGAGPQQLNRDCKGRGIQVRTAEVRAFQTEYETVFDDLSDKAIWHPAQTKIPCGDITVNAGVTFQGDAPEWWDKFDARVGVVGVITWNCCPGRDAAALAVSSAGLSEVVKCG